MRFLSTRLFAAIVGASVMAGGVAGCQQAPPETKDRLTPEAMKAMVEEPISTVHQQGLARGAQQFAHLLATTEARYGPDSVQVADLLTAFGVGLYSQGYDDDNRVESEASLKYLREAVPHYRKAFNPQHPEVAVALHSLADAEISLTGHLTPEAEAALDEALRIRRAALGPNNPETRATARRLTRASGINCSSDRVDSAARALCEAGATDSE